MSDEQGTSKTLDENETIFLYIGKLVHEGNYNARISWGEFREVFSKIFSEDPIQTCKKLESKSYMESCRDDDPFMILKRISSEPPPEIRSKIISGIFEILRSNNLAYNVAVLSYLQKTLIMAIIGSFYDQQLEFSSSPEERVLISAVTSDEFLKSEEVSTQMEREMRKIETTSVNLENYLVHPWFNELILIVKNGYYGNGSFNFINTLESSFRAEFVKGILEVLRSGGLLWLIMNFRTFIKRDRVDSALKEFVRKSREDRKLGRYYDWLSIGNDFAIGIEFLIGSIEFFPGYNSTAGIYLFIVGSLQLFSRPIITTFKRIHQRKLDSRRIRFQ